MPVRASATRQRITTGDPKQFSMHCGEALSRILDYVHGELVMHERRAMERHFEVCASCRARMEFERRLGERLQELREH